MNSRKKKHLSMKNITLNNQFYLGSYVKTSSIINMYHWKFRKLQGKIIKHK